MGGSVGQSVGSGHITKYQINLDLIEIIQFCLNIYDLLDIFLDILLKPPQPLMGLFFSFFWETLDLPLNFLRTLPEHRATTIFVAEMGCVCLPHQASQQKKFVFLIHFFFHSWRKYAKK